MVICNEDGGYPQYKYYTDNECQKEEKYKKYNDSVIVIGGEGSVDDWCDWGIKYNDACGNAVNTIDGTASTPTTTEDNTPGSNKANTLNFIFATLLVAVSSIILN